MFLFRSLTIGLLGACILLLARIERPPAAVATQPATLALAAPMPVAATIVDVAPGVRASEVPGFLRLAPGERVIAVDDRTVESDLAAGVAIANRASASGTFVDLDVEGGGGAHRRVLVLLH